MPKAVSSKKSDPKPLRRPPRKVSLFPVGDDLNIHRVQEKEADPNSYESLTERPKERKADKNDGEENGDFHGEKEKLLTEKTNSENANKMRKSDLELIAQYGSKRERMLDANANGDGSSIKVVDFNVQEEYENNLAAKASGELTEMQAPLRSVAPGRHSLTQLLGVAHSQKEQYEEHFAQGLRNRKESKKQYGF